MARRLVNTPVTLTVRFDVDGTGTDPNPDSATLAVAAADGTVVVAAGTTAQQGTNPGEFTYQIQAAANTRLDTWTVTWTSALGIVSDIVEIAGGFLFSVSDARDALGDQTYSAAKIQAARLTAETEIERALGYALVPRYTLEQLSGRGWRVPLRVSKPYVRSVRSITADTYTLTPADLATVTFDGAYLYGYGWPNGHGNIVVGYEHGLDTAPAGASAAALDEAVEYLGGAPASGSIDPRAESLVTPDGTIRLRPRGSGMLSASAADWVSYNRIPALA